MVLKKLFLCVFFTFFMSYISFGHDILWTAKILPQNVIVCKGSICSFSFIEEAFTVSGLPQGEYVQLIQKQYRWRIGDNLVFNGERCSVNTASPGFEERSYPVILEGTAKYLIKWTDGDIEHQEGPFQIDWRTLTSSQFTVDKSSYDWGATTSIGVVSDLELMRGELLKKVQETVCRVLPGIKAKLKSVSVLYSQKKKACCLEGIKIQEGEFEKKCSFSTSLDIAGYGIAIISAMSGAPIPTTHSFSVSVPGGEIEFDCTYDIVISASTDLSGSVGKRESACNSESNCLFGATGISYNFQIAPTIEAIVCVKTVFLDDCTGVVLEPIYSNMVLDVNLGYNIDSCDDGWKINGTLGNINVGFRIKVLTFEFSKEIELLKGFTF